MQSVAATAGAAGVHLGAHHDRLALDRALGWKLIE
jgi:hypothetical protein